MRRAGTRDWVDAPVGTKLYGGDSIRSEDGESSIRHADGSTQPVRRDSLVEVGSQKPQKVKKPKVTHGTVSFSAKDAGDALAKKE